MSKKWKRYDRHGRYQGYSKQSNDDDGWGIIIGIIIICCLLGGC